MHDPAGPRGYSHFVRATKRCWCLEPLAVLAQSLLETRAASEVAAPSPGGVPRWGAPTRPVPCFCNYCSGITAGSDGALWFTETGANQIGQISPSTDVITLVGALRLRA